MNRDKPEKEVAPVVPAVNVPQVTANQRDIQKLIAEVSSNRAEVQFPTDPWGFTRDVRKALLDAAASVRGNDVKMKLLMETLAVGLAHAKKRFPEDKDKMKRVEETQAKYAGERAERERWTPVVKTGVN